MNDKPIIEEGQKFPLTIKRLGINGEGIGFFKRNVVFVPGALPGEEITAQVTNVKRNFAEARILKMRTPSPHRQTPPCPIYEACGGCQLQHMTYSQQLVEKRDLVVQALDRYLKGVNVKIENTIGMEDPWYYRNKSQFQTRLKGTQVIAGLFAEGSHQLLDIEQCIVQHPNTTRITNEVKRVLEDLKMPIYDGKTMKGIVRTIVVRTGVETGEIQLVLITTRARMPQKEMLIDLLKELDPNIVSIVQNINKEKTSLIFGEETITLWGKDTIHEKLGELSFDLSARAFFQLNPKQTVKLYDEIKRAADLTGNESVVDAYCGVGTIGLWLADRAKEIRGMDLIHESVVDAKANAKKHGYDAKYVTGSAEKWLETWRNEGYVPDVLTVDPPRTGLGESLIKTILKVKPKRFIYTSCNPSTLAKDLQQLTKVYKIEYIQPIDMFPQTAQVESVTKLILK
ncbi:23S rRNA (uracil(1939)-C(5))-methyltransferase RlmD [Planococcus shenhongbingii]|uniref:23S rRNA (Uracil(1939)-C(5))-methyltransferase RlmD n=1 Tax=Planococcus shenhongbingii TaxID=3058398 RepID=A0ABT8NHU5_9BACL|nr:MULTISPECIES: 23S rRNA (uracil(1939)-C(5))-methyltransferase RlmD [unclassified Planococcus (in: firmicutes)]MDN7247449.1 23S rRNA (uracil(1939)-C(5))-methyltransferase RlmD [Planococcus sp. N017]WKA59577.1 23S rRNA (uracil(1939)-C(5))-methyltransferase RlmD [Planococcus sp. N016]